MHGKTLKHFSQRFALRVSDWLEKWFPVLLYLCPIGCRDRR